MERTLVSFDTLAPIYSRTCGIDEEPSIELLQRIIDEQGLGNYEVVTEMDLCSRSEGELASSHLVLSIRLRSALEENKRYWPVEVVAVENRQLRRLLALVASKGLLYTDDGELSDASMHPTIDYRRMSPNIIETALRNRNAKIKEQEGKSADVD